MIQNSLQSKRTEFCAKNFYSLRFFNGVEECGGVFFNTK